MISLSDFIYAAAAVPTCVALASISMCRLNYLDVRQSRFSWVARYFALGCLAAGVGFEALLQPQIFATELAQWVWRGIGLVGAAAGLYAVLQTRCHWTQYQAGQAADAAPKESNRGAI
jgi:hypothetical protein